jgi:hypothetical protein
MTRTLIKCADIRYRQGFVEVLNVHANHVNLEIWNVHPDLDLAPTSVDLERVPDDAIGDNTEIELSIPQARQLVDWLQSAIARAENGEV